MSQDQADDILLKALKRKEGGNVGSSVFEDEIMREVFDIFKENYEKMSEKLIKEILDELK